MGFGTRPPFHVATVHCGEEDAVSRDVGCRQQMRGIQIGEASDDRNEACEGRSKGSKPEWSIIGIHTFS